MTDNTGNDKPKSNAGRPPLYSSREELQQVVDSYFEHREAEELPFTICGLALALDMTRETLIQYGKKEQFSDIISKAKMKCQDYAESSLYSKHANGAKFVLAANYNWVERKGLDLTADIGEDTAKMLGDLTNKSEKSWQK